MTTLLDAFSLCYQGFSIFLNHLFFLVHSGAYPFYFAIIYYPTIGLSYCYCYWSLKNPTRLLPAFVILPLMIITGIRKRNRKKNRLK